MPFLTTDELTKELEGAKSSYRMMLSHREQWPKHRKPHGERNLVLLRNRIDYLAGELSMAAGK